ncbi:hypothetical protein PG990_013764 [Apiospora arundinis]
MSSFNEDIDEGPNLHEELPFWQEELSSSSFSSSSSEDGTKEYERSDGGSVGSDNEIFSNKASYPGQRGRISNYPTRRRPRDWHPKEGQLPLKFKARSVSPHTAWRAEVDWQTFIKFGSEARSTNWIGDPFHTKDKSIFELRRKPSWWWFKDTPRRNSMPTVSAAVPARLMRPWDVFTKALDPAVEYGFNCMRQLTTTRSEESFAVARAWLADCILGHGKSRAPGPTPGHIPQRWAPRCQEG